MVFCAILFILVPIFLSTLTGRFSATDWVYRHSVWIGQYLRGDFSALVNYYPLFEFLMLPFVAMNFPMQWFQVIFAGLAAFGILYMTYRLESEKTLLYVSILLASSIAFVEFAGSMMPQALDYLVFPIAVVFYYQKRVKYTAGLLLLDFGMHGAGFIFTGILFLHAMLTKRSRYAKLFFVMLMVMLPFFVWYSFYGNAMEWDYAAQDAWELPYLWPPWNFFFFSGLLAWALLPFALNNLRKVKFKLTEMQLLYVIWIAGFMPLAAFHYGIWRMVSFQIVPLSLLVASLMPEGENDEKV
jgi:hypothetical protein